MTGQLEQQTGRELKKIDVPIDSVIHRADRLDTTVRAQHFYRSDLISDAIF